MGTRCFYGLLLLNMLGVLLSSCNLGLFGDETSPPSVVISSPTGD